MSSATSRVSAITLILMLAGCAPQPSNFSPTLSMEGSSAADMPLRQSSTNRQIAVTHRFTLQVPSAQTEAVQQRHLDQCAKLNCTILSTSIDRSNEGRINARASVRISPEAYPAFAVLLAVPPARITIHSQSAEDLGTPIKAPRGEDGTAGPPGNNA
jgi:hypothetical protein